MKAISILCLIAVCALVFTVTAAFALSGNTYMLGDVDGDDEVTVLDVTSLQRYLSDIPVPYLNEAAADVDGNGLDIRDATFIQRYLADMDIAYEIGEYVYVQPTETTSPTNPKPTNNYELPFIPA